MQPLKDFDAELTPEQRERLNAAGKAWVERKDPAAQELMGFDEMNSEARKAERERMQRKMVDGNARMIRREWEAAGLEPQHYSMSLAKSLGYMPKKKEEAA